MSNKVIATLTVDDVPSAIAVNVAASEPTHSDVTIDMKVEPQLVESFNKTHNKNYELLPQAAYKLENTTLHIASGSHVTETGLKLSIIDRDAMKFGTTYVLPVSIDRVTGTSMPVIEASRTIYLVVNHGHTCSCYTVDAHRKNVGCTEFHCISVDDAQF